MLAEKDLPSLGLMREWIVETIVSTFKANGTPNAAPMGAVLEDVEHIWIRPFTSTLTYRCLMDRRAAVVNITSDPLLYYRSVFKETNPGGVLPEEWFEKAELVDAPRLREAEACIEVDVVKSEAFGVGRAKVLCKVRTIYVRGGRRVQAYSRAVHAVMESVIHADRIKVFLNRGEMDRVDRLVELVFHYDSIVKRVAPGSMYSNVMAELVSRIRLGEVGRFEGSG